MQASWSQEQLAALPGLSLHDVMLLPLERVKAFFDVLALPPPLDEATEMLLDELRARLAFLVDVGVGYLTLDRQSRTLSGGEVQRINLTTALGTSLVNTLFVLDEPSIGLHPRDMHRVVEVMHRLRDAGNSLVVVEHDPQVMLAADRVLDMGPGPGERGGRIVFNGTPDELRRAETLTGRYLGGRQSVDASRPLPVASNAPKLVLQGAREHNLKAIDIEIPLKRLICVTGVSGSGKSTLIQDVLYPALAKAKGKSTEAPGAFDRLLGDDWLDDVAFVDQSQIGKTTRSNPASYVGAFDAIRSIFAKSRIAKERNYTPGTFSFNSGDGRCPTCGGNGFEHVEMQFLSDVYLRCPDCDGKRFRPETLEVTVERGTRVASIADVLDMTVSEALAFFRDDAEVARVLAPLVDVGLEYVKLGQPVPTLSGGEAQRLKLAGFLAEAASGKPPTRGTLFLFDEPTTGLHFDDVAKLMRAFRKLLAAGHSLVVIEHNLDVISAADWLIDLGPEGGDARRRSRRGRPAGRRDRRRALAHRPRTCRLPRRAGEPRAARQRTASELRGREAAADADERATPRAARCDRSAQRARAQPEVDRRRHSARHVHRHHRRLGLGQVDAGVRHPLQRGSTPLPRIAERLRALDRAAGGTTRRRRDLRHPADGGHRAAHFARRPQVDGRHADRALPLPAAHLREARRAALSRLQRAGDAAVVRRDRRAGDARTEGPAHRRAGAAGRQSQGRVHRPRQVGRGTRPLAPARRRRFPADREVPAHRALQGTHDRTAGSRSCRVRRPTRPSCAARWRTALEHGHGVATVVAPLQALQQSIARGDWGPVADAEELLDQARLPVVRTELSRTGPAPLFVQQQARLVRRLLRHRTEAHRLRCRAKRRRSLVERLVRRRGRGL